MKIPIELKPYPDEILSSWLIRNSVACGSDPSSWVGGIWLEFRAWTRDIDRHLPLNEIRSLSKITSLSQNQIKNMTLEPLIIKIYTNDLLNPRKAWPFVIPTGSRGGRKINGTYFCKDCLQEPNFYLKKQWRLAWNVACAKHKQILIHRCPKCNEAFAPHLITYENTSLYQCSFCGYDLRLCTSTNANQEVLHFQEELNQIIFSKKFNSVFPVFEQTVQELFSTIRVLLSFCRYLIYSNKYQSFLNKIGMKDVIAISGHSSSATFEAMAAKDRQKLLLIISKISKLELEEIKQIFIDTNISQKALLNQISYPSKTINYLASNLQLSDNRLIKAEKKKLLLPKSKEEVEKLMDEIRKFI